MQYEERGDPYWWIPLVTGSLWMLFALVVFRFDYTTVDALAILLGTVCLAASVLEAAAAAATHGWWRAGHLALTAGFAIVGVVAFVHPGDTLAALAAVFAFYLFLRGISEIVVAVLTHGEELWWIRLVSGVAQLLLAFWAAGDFGHQAILLVVWVGASAFLHGLTQIIAAFRLRPPRAPTLRAA